MNNVIGGFAARHHAKNGPTTMRRALEKHHEAERALIMAGDEAALARAMARMDSAAGLPYVLENDDMRELLMARFGVHR